MNDTSQNGPALVLKCEAVTSKIIGVFYEVYNELGCGFVESVYEKAMFIALPEYGLSVRRQQPVPMFFRKRRIGQYFADLVVENQVIIELKATQTLDRSAEAQLLHYLKATCYEVGLLLNFGTRAQFRRLLFDNDRKNLRANPCESVQSVAPGNPT